MSVKYVNSVFVLIIHNVSFKGVGKQFLFLKYLDRSKVVVSPRFHSLG